MLAGLPRNFSTRRPTSRTAGTWPGRNLRLKSAAIHPLVLFGLTFVSNATGIEVRALRLRLGSSALRSTSIAWLHHANPLPKFVAHLLSICHLSARFLNSQTLIAAKISRRVRPSVFFRLQKALPNQEGQPDRPLKAVSTRFCRSKSAKYASPEWNSRRNQNLWSDRGRWRGTMTASFSKSRRFTQFLCLNLSEKFFRVRNCLKERGRIDTQDANVAVRYLLILPGKKSAPWEVTP